MKLFDKNKYNHSNSVYYVSNGRFYPKFRKSPTDVSRADFSVILGLESL